MIKWHNNLDNIPQYTVHATYSYIEKLCSWSVQFLFFERLQKQDHINCQVVSNDFKTFQIGNFFGKTKDLRHYVIKWRFFIPVAFSIM